MSSQDISKVSFVLNQDGSVSQRDSLPFFHQPHYIDATPAGEVCEDDSTSETPFVKREAEGQHIAAETHTASFVSPTDLPLPPDPPEMRRDSHSLINTNDDTNSLIMNMFDAQPMNVRGYKRRRSSPPVAKPEHVRFPHKLISAVNNPETNNVVTWSSDGSTILILNRDLLAKALKVKPVSLDTDLRKHRFKRIVIPKEDFEILRQSGKQIEAYAVAHEHITRDNCGKEVLSRVKRRITAESSFERIASDIARRLLEGDALRPSIRYRLFSAVWSTFADNERMTAISIATGKDVDKFPGTSPTTPATTSTVSTTTPGEEITTDQVQTEKTEDISII